MMQPQLIDTVASLTSLLQGLPPLQKGRPDLYVDLEGDDLCRHGTLSLVTIFVESRRSVHLIDITTLREQAFAASDSQGRTLRLILEADSIVKVFFDIRNDSDALFSHYGIRVQGIEDVQLMELASRYAHSSKLRFNGLAKCIESNPDLDPRERRGWSVVKDRGKRLFRTGKDGYAIFDRRPLPAEVLEYCVQDVTFLPKLRDSYRAKLCNASWRKVQEETLTRITLSQTRSYNGRGRHMALGPSTWQKWNPSLAEKQERSLLQEEKPVHEFSDEGVKTPDEAVQERADEEELGPIGRALQDMTVRGPSPDEDDHDHYGHEGSNSEPNSGEQSPQDYTACDSECGYCGHCMY